MDDIPTGSILQKFPIWEDWKKNPKVKNYVRKKDNRFYRISLDSSYKGEPDQIGCTYEELVQDRFRLRLFRR